MGRRSKMISTWWGHVATCVTRAIMESRDFEECCTELVFIQIYETILVARRYEITKSVLVKCRLNIKHVFQSNVSSNVTKKGCGRPSLAPSAVWMKCLREQKRVTLLRWIFLDGGCTLYMIKLVKVFNYFNYFNIHFHRALLVFARHYLGLYVMSHIQIWRLHAENCTLISFWEFPMKHWNINTGNTQLQSSVCSISAVLWTFAACCSHSMHLSYQRLRHPKLYFLYFSVEI